MELMHIVLAALMLALVLILHVTAPPPRKAPRRSPKHLRPYDELRLTNL